VVDQGFAAEDLVKRFGKVLAVDGFSRAAVPVAPLAPPDRPVQVMVPPAGVTDE